ncbi:MAG: manganese efflux pump [Desulfobacteraceae bacterium]|nr:MAG: manganese efflux pump [Desulfobacteraceae bacterium]
MTAYEMIMVAAGLAMDAAAVSLAAAAAGYAKDKRAIFRLSFHFGLFQFMMPVAGWFSGVYFVQYISRYNHWVAFGLLGFVGARMIWSGVNPVEEDQKSDPSRGMTLVMLSVATSIDALAVGLSLAMIGVNIWYPSVMIGMITAMFSLAAIALGKRVGALAGHRMEIIGGIILLGIGIKILLSH